MNTVKNAVMRVDGHTLVIEIDLNHSLGPSASGKSELVAGAVSPVPGVEGVHITLSVYRPKRVRGPRKV